MEQLIAQLKEKMIETLQLEDVAPNDIDENDQLVEGALGIDSIDILELVMMIEKDYAVKIDNKEVGKAIFRNLTTLAEYIQENTREMPA